MTKNAKQVMVNNIGTFAKYISLYTICKYKKKTKNDRTTNTKAEIALQTFL